MQEGLQEHDERQVERMKREAAADAHRNRAALSRAGFGLEAVRTETAGAAPPSNRKVNWIRAKVWLPDGMDSGDVLWD
jgi:hypothetical protein